MSNHHGNEGTVKLGSNVVAEIREFEISSEDEPADDTAMGDAWETHKSGGPKRWTGSLTCWWDETDTNGQVVLVAGASVTLNMYPEGDATGDKFFTGTATVVGNVTQSNLRNIVEARFSFRGNGALAIGTAS